MPANLFEPRIHRRSRSQTFKLRSQILLHGLALQCSTAGEFVSNFLGNVANSDLNRHAGILPAPQLFYKCGCDSDLGYRSWMRRRVSANLSARSEAKVRARHGTGCDNVVVITAEELRRMKGNVTGEALIKAMQASPYRDMNIEPTREPMPVRDISL